MANLPATLEPTTWKPIKVTFTPTANGDVESIFKINTSVGVFSYTLKGEGYGAAVDPTTPAPPGSGTSVIPKATLLTSEFYNNQDLDGNGKIYGYDFKISDDDSKPPKKPVILCIVEKSPYWTNPTSEMTWDAFVSGS